MANKKATAKIVVEDQVVLTIEGITLKFNAHLAKEIGEKLFKAGCALKEREES